MALLHSPRPSRAVSSSQDMDGNAVDSCATSSMPTPMPDNPPGIERTLHAEAARKLKTSTDAHAVHARAAIEKTNKVLAALGKRKVVTNEDTSAIISYDEISPSKKPLAAPAPATASQHGDSERQEVPNARPSDRYMGRRARRERGSYVLNVVAISIPALGDVAQQLFTAKRGCTASHFNQHGLLRIQELRNSHVSRQYFSPLFLSHHSLSSFSLYISIVFSQSLSHLTAPCH